MELKITAETWEPAVDLERAACAFCGSREGKFLFAGRDRLHNLPGRFAVIRCRVCGLMRTDPRPTRESIGYYYPENYGPYLETAAEPSGRLRRLGRKMFSGLDTATPRLSPGRLLEIGAASGNFLVQMQRAGWDVTGIEFDPTSAKRTASRTGAPVFCGHAESFSLDAGSFDLICAWMTFEHLEDPIKVFRNCFSWLKPDGWLAFSVPDCGSWQFRVFEADWFALHLPAHLYHFTTESLGRILAACGYTRVRIQWQRTLVDPLMSIAFAAETRFGQRIGSFLRTCAGSLPSRAVARVLGQIAGPLRLTGRLTVWAQKPVG